MTIINPADAVEARAAVEASLSVDGPVYMRFGRYAVPVFNDAESYKFEIGKGVTMAEGTDLTIVGSGFTVQMALEARDLLAEKGILARVINIHTIKPIDREILVKAAKETGAILTVEEHSVIGGLGSAVCEVLSEECPVPVMRMGTQDTFGKSGTVPALLEEYGLTPAHVAEKAQALLAKK